MEVAGRNVSGLAVEFGLGSDDVIHVLTNELGHASLPWRYLIKRTARVVCVKDSAGNLLWEGFEAKPSWRSVIKID